MIVCAHLYQCIQRSSEYILMSIQSSPSCAPLTIWEDKAQHFMGFREISFFLVCTTPTAPLLLLFRCPTFWLSIECRTESFLLAATILAPSLWLSLRNWCKLAFCTIWFTLVKRFVSPLIPSESHRCCGPTVLPLFGDFCRSHNFFRIFLVLWHSAILARLRTRGLKAAETVERL